MQALRGDLLLVSRGDIPESQASVPLQRERPSRERGVGNILISLLPRTPDSESPVTLGVSYTCIFNLVVVIFQSIYFPFLFHPATILPRVNFSSSSESFPLSFHSIPISHHVCSYYDAPPAVVKCICFVHSFRKKNHSCLLKIWNLQLIIPHLLYFKNEHGQG